MHFSIKQAAILAFGLHSASAAPTAVSSSATSTSTPKIILAPVRSIPHTLLTAAKLSTSATIDATALNPIVPQTNVTLNYASINASDPMAASINATMKYPSVLLEEIDSIKSVDCSATSVDVVFGNKVDFDLSFADWPSSTFILFTSHLGDCDSDNERGLYIVSKVTFNNDTLTVTATSEKSTFDNASVEMGIDFTRPATTTTKREISQTWFGDFPGTITLVEPGPVTSSLSVKVNDPKVSGHLGVSGHIHYSWFHLKPTSFYVDMHLGVAASANIDVAAGIAYDNDVYSFSPASLSISAFTIPGILDVGPRMEITLGVELAVSGTVDISADLTYTISEGSIHLDFLDSSKSSTTGWTPVYTHAVNVSATVEAQINPYVELTAAVGVNLLNGVLDLSTGVKARPELINVFTVNAEFDISNTANVTLPAPTETTCTNGMWYSSAFAFIVSGFVTQFYEVELYRLDVPIYKSGCWSWVPGAIEGGVPK